MANVAQTIDWKLILLRAQDIYASLRAEDTFHHNSHVASKALKQVAEEFDGVGYGIEGFCDGQGNHGVTYINMGDTYATTLLFESETGKFSIGSWGDIVECAPADRYP